MTKNLVTNRNIEELKEPFQTKVKMFLSDDRIKDKIFVSEWLRSKQRQIYLYSLWRTEPWPVVTWTLNSKHIDWLAIDIAFKWNILYPNDFNQWRYIADIAKEYWIDWGYDLWGQDKPHFQDNWLRFKNMNRFKKILDEKIKDWYNPIFEDLQSNEELNEAEVKTLIEIWIANLIERMNWKNKS